MTLITYEDSSGNKHVCDARCYNATHSMCHCICSGVNHQKGLMTAAENTRTLAGKWLKEIERRDKAGELAKEIEK